MVHFDVPGFLNSDFKMNIPVDDKQTRESRQER